MVTTPSLNSWISAGKKALCMIAHATRRWKVIAGMIFDNGTRDALLLKLVLSCRGWRFSAKVSWRVSEAHPFLSPPCECASHHENGRFPDVSMSLRDLMAVCCDHFDQAWTLLRMKVHKRQWLHHCYKMHVGCLVFASHGSSCSRLESERHMRSNPMMMIWLPRMGLLKSAAPNYQHHLVTCFISFPYMLLKSTEPLCIYSCDRRETLGNHPSGRSGTFGHCIVWVHRCPHPHFWRFWWGRLCRLCVIGDGAETRLWSMAPWRSKLIAI